MTFNILTNTLFLYSTQFTTRLSVFILKLRASDVVETLIQKMWSIIIIIEIHF